MLTGSLDTSTVVVRGGSWRLCDQAEYTRHREIVYEYKQWIYIIHRHLYIYHLAELSRDLMLIYVHVGPFQELQFSLSGYLEIRTIPFKIIKGLELALPT